MHIVLTHFAQTLVWKHEYDVKLRRQKQHTPNTDYHRMPLNETLLENFLRTPLKGGESLTRQSDANPITQQCKVGS